MWLKGHSFYFSDLLICDVVSVWDFQAFKVASHFKDISVHRTTSLEISSEDPRFTSENLYGGLIVQKFIHKYKNYYEIVVVPFFFLFLSICMNILHTNNIIIPENQNKPISFVYHFYKKI